MRMVFFVYPKYDKIHQVIFSCFLTWNKNRKMSSFTGQRNINLATMIPKIFPDGDFRGWEWSRTTGTGFFKTMLYLLSYLNQILKNFCFTKIKTFFQTVKSFF